MTETGFDIGAEFFVDLGKKIDAIHAQAAKWRMVLYRNDVIDQIALTAGAGTYDSPVKAGPVRGQCWDIRRLSAWGFTAGTVQAQLNALEPLAQWTGAAAPSTTLPATFGKGEIILQPGDRITFTATGITGQVIIAIGPTAMPYEYLTEYLS